MQHFRLKSRSSRCLATFAEVNCIDASSTPGRIACWRQQASNGSGNAEHIAESRDAAILRQELERLKAEHCIRLEAARNACPCRRAVGQQAAAIADESKVPRYTRLLACARCRQACLMLLAERAVSCSCPRLRTNSQAASVCCPFERRLMYTQIRQGHPQSRLYLCCSEHDLF
jgi:hypothetical protein